MISERLTDQAFETLENNECENGDVINPFNKVVNKSGVSPVITTRPEGMKTAVLPVEKKNLKPKIRRLTPRECGRLMSVSDDDITKMESVNSNSELYRQFGDSICVNVMCDMFSQMKIKGVKPWNTITDEEKELWTR